MKEQAALSLKVNPLVFASMSSVVRSLFYLTSFLVVSGSVGSAEDAELTARPGPEGQPTEVKIGIFMLDLDDISGANQTYTANVAYAASWQDDRLKHEGPGTRTMEVGEIWHPRLQILNQQRLQYTFSKDVRVHPDGKVEGVQRVWGQFSQPFTLHDFPFDSQDLHFTLVAAGFEPHEVQLVVDPDEPSRIADAFSISDWRVLNWQAAPKDLVIVRGSNPVPSFEMMLNMKRNSGYHYINIILPLVMIICMSWIVFWVPPKQIGPRISVSVTTMLTLVAYRFAVAASLPKIAYLTRMDWFILCSSLLIFASLLQVVVTTYLAEKEKLVLARRINQCTRVAAPIAFVIVAYFSLW